MSSINFSKTFDSVKKNINGLRILSMYGITQKTISAIRTIYDNSQTTVNTSDGPKNLFSTLPGILQEYTIAFKICL